MKRLTDNFLWSELTVTNTGLPNIPNKKEVKNLAALTFNVLQPIRDLMGEPVIITSGFRSEVVNNEVGGEKTSQHRKGLAADFVLTDRYEIWSAFDKIRKSLIPYDQLIYEHDKDENDIWIHVSYSENPRMQSLTMLKENGIRKYTQV